MANYSGTWALGAGYTVIFASTTYADPLQILTPRGTPSVFTKDLVTLGGVTALIGKKRNRLGEIAVRVADITADTLVTEPPTSGTLTIVDPSGTSKSCTAYLVGDETENIDPEAEMVRKITFKPLTPPA